MLKELQIRTYHCILGFLLDKSFQKKGEGSGFVIRTLLRWRSKKLHFMRARASVLKTNIWLRRRSSSRQEATNAWWEEKKTEQCGTICLAMALGLKYALFTCWRAAQRLSQKGFDQWKLTTRLPDIWLQDIWLQDIWLRTIDSRTIDSGHLTPGQLTPDTINN